MAGPVVPVQTYHNPSNDDESDYGSDFSPEEQEIIDQLLVSASASLVAADRPITNDVEYAAAPASARVPRLVARETVEIEYEAHGVANAQSMQSNAEIGVNINIALDANPGYPDLSSALSSLAAESDSTTVVPAQAPVADPAEPVRPDPRSPLERFRTAPKKALSVTDLVSPAWCELQYWYTLTIHGRKVQTEAMKRGSAVHQELEEQIYTAVKVDVQTKEDAWALRIWNVIQGLRTLRDTGMTRELEVWGTIDGEVVNGIIDEVSFTCPDTDLEEQAEESAQEVEAEEHTRSKNELPPDQKTLSEYFKHTGAATLTQTLDKSLRRARPSKPPPLPTKLYITDVKTRSVSSLPRGAAFRPTKLQLMLYHTLLSQLAVHEVDFAVLARRYDLDASAPFSDAFIAQVGSLDDEVFYDACSAPSSPAASEEEDMSNALAVLLAHNSLEALWGLMMQAFAGVAPAGAGSIGRILTAEYRARESGEVIGNHTFVMDEEVLGMYVGHEMGWWRGRRKAEGVVVEEAYKCRSCEFAGGCEWRIKQVEEARGRARRGWAG